MDTSKKSISFQCYKIRTILRDKEEYCGKYKLQWQRGIVQFSREERFFFKNAKVDNVLFQGGFNFIYMQLSNGIIQTELK